MTFDAAIAKYHKQGLTAAEAAKALRCSKVRVRKWARHHGVAFATVAGRRAMRIAACYAEGLTAGEAAEKAGCTRMSVYRWAHDNGVTWVQPKDRLAARLAECHAQGYDLERAAQVAGCIPVTAKQWARRAGVSWRRKGDIDMIEDTPAFRDMWRGDLRLSDIAAHFRVSEYFVKKCAEAHGYGPRKRGYGPRLPKAPKPIAPRPTVWLGVAPRSPGTRPEVLARAVDPALVDRVLATKGKYQALADLAAQYNWTMTKAQQFWHQVRVSQ